MNRTHTTALHVAATKGETDIIDLLIKRGANVNQLDDDGWSALHFAGAQENRDSVRRLLSAGAVPFELTDSAQAAYASGVVYQEYALTGAPASNFLIAAEDFAEAATLYEGLANQVQEDIEAQHAKNAFAMALGAFAVAIQPGTPMPSAGGGTVRFYQPVVVPVKGTATLHSTQAAYLASMEQASANEQRCREAVGRH
jgi:ankyrin repeat protein